MNQSKIKQFIKEHMLDLFFYTYLLKLTFYNTTHSKAEIYLGTLLSVVMLINKFMQLKDNELKNKFKDLDKKIKALANSLNTMGGTLQKVGKVVDVLNARKEFSNIKSPFSFKQK